MSDDDQDNKSPQGSLPDVASLKESVILISDSERRRQAEQSRQTNIDSERKYVHLAGLQDHYKQKGKWSRSVSYLMFLLVGFQCLLLWRVGVGAWNFEKYQWLLPALLIQNFGQIVGLALIVVKALFSDVKD